MRKPERLKEKERRRTHQELEQVIAVLFKESNREKNKRSVCVCALRFPSSRRIISPFTTGREKERKVARDLSLSQIQKKREERTIPNVSRLTYYSGFIFLIRFFCVLL